MDKKLRPAVTEKQHYVRSSLTQHDHSMQRNHKPWKAGDCGATTVTGFVMGAEEKGSSDGALKALVIWEHRALMLSVSPSTSGTKM